ncbi:MAG: hypothetical protein KDD50_13845 [Bdellovibrionales bacterium]|nr:hypothetical protein [Bdellovibrionales bacterium]
MKPCSVLLLLLLSVVNFVGCAVGPFSEGQTARSLKKGQLEIVTQLEAIEDEDGVNASPVGHIQYGVSDRFDISAKTEFQTYSFGSKYSFVNSMDRGYSAATIFNLILASSQISYQMGIIQSYKTKYFEPYISVKYNLANINPADFDKTFFKSSSDLSFNFLTHSYGLKIWITQDVSVGPELTILEKPSGSTEFKYKHLCGLLVSIKF